MVISTIEQYIVGDAVPAEFTVPDRGFGVLRMEFVTKPPLLASFVSRQYSHLV